MIHEWMANHGHKTYPNDVELLQLMRDTGLTKEQVRNVMINARKRGKVQGVPS